MKFYLNFLPRATLYLHSIYNEKILTDMIERNFPNHYHAIQGDNCIIKSEAHYQAIHDYIAQYQACKDEHYDLEHYLYELRQHYPHDSHHYIALTEAIKSFQRLFDSTMQTLSPPHLIREVKKTIYPFYEKIQKEYQND